MNKIVLVGLICLSLGAFAQSNNQQSQTGTEKSVASPRDAASGQASGKRMHKPMLVHRDLAARDAASGQASGKTATSSSSSASSTPRVATGDVDGDGRTEVKAVKDSGHATEKDAVLHSSSTIQSPRDAASGQATGKRQHKPVTVTKELDKASTK